jgi:hypothetical protein
MGSHTRRRPCSACWRGQTCLLQGPHRSCSTLATWDTDSATTSVRPSQPACNVCMRNGRESRPRLRCPDPSQGGATGGATDDVGPAVRARSIAQHVGQVFDRVDRDQHAGRQHRGGQEPQAPCLSRGMSRAGALRRPGFLPLPFPLPVPFPDASARLRLAGLGASCLTGRGS